ncbi:MULTISPECIES: FkbM family methyltransferase [Cyanophyceae]|uniref:FkbM family methyltransferase n=1 Tax=Cyanophyceae TaxID=3028117 RepID=UPI00168588BD|nr:FkbM family methyltransferase [Trichocoleus sp. FACHB-69]MBD1934843.1 FkbM family methyltransferase [Trichocoleus sp. FACHB-69]
METNFASADSYWKYLEKAGVALDSDASSRVTTILEATSWDNPTSALDLNNFAVVALIEAEQSEDSSFRALYVEMALQALNTGVELGNPLCAAHLALVLAIIGEIDLAMQIAFSTFITNLHPAYINDKLIALGIVYLPPTSTSLIDSHYGKLAQILQTEDGYKQLLILLSEVMCRSSLVFYNVTGLRFLHLAAHLSSNSTSLNLKLGISSLMNNQWEGILHLQRAREIAPDSANIVQALYLAYRNMGEIEIASFWLGIGRDLSRQNPASPELQWTKLEADSLLTYVPFENNIILAVEPSLRSIVTSVLIAEGDWFEQEMEFWRNWIKPGMTVIDVGANVGVYTFSAALKVGSEGCVLAVEPFSGCVRCLQETCKINELSWVKVCAGAASDRNGTARLSLQAASELNELVAIDAEGSTQPDAFEEVDCFSLDSLIERENVNQVNFLKIDAEGHEMQVLEGSSRILNEFAPAILYENIAGNKGSNLAVAEFLTFRGYQLFRYQPYLQQLIPVNSAEDLQGRLNIIALHTQQL